MLSKPLEHNKAEHRVFQNSKQKMSWGLWQKYSQRQGQLDVYSLLFNKGPFFSDLEWTEGQSISFVVQALRRSNQYAALFCTDLKAVWRNTSMKQLSNCGKSRGRVLICFERNGLLDGVISVASYLGRHSHQPVLRQDHIHRPCNLGGRKKLELRAQSCRALSCVALLEPGTALCHGAVELLHELFFIFTDRRVRLPSLNLEFLFTRLQAINLQTYQTISGLFVRFTADRQLFSVWTQNEMGRWWHVSTMKQARISPKNHPTSR